MKRYNPIFFTELNNEGAWVIYGEIGIKRYYGYTKEEAKKSYKIEAWKIQGQFENQWN